MNSGRAILQLGSTVKEDGTLFDCSSRFREARTRLDLLVNLRLREATRSKASLKDNMEEVSRKAQERGLTQDALQSILDE